MDAERRVRAAHTGRGGADAPRAGRRQPIPTVVRDRGTLTNPDYADVFALSGPGMDDWSPEEWARAMFGDVPDLGEVFIWRVLLRLRLAKGVSADHVAGWQVADRGDEWLRLEAASSLVRSQLVVSVGADEVSLGTFLCYDRAPAAWLWTPMSALHRRLAPGLLLGAYRMLSEA